MAQLPNSRMKITTPAVSPTQQFDGLVGQQLGFGRGGLAVDPLEHDHPEEDQVRQKGAHEQRRQNGEK